jgi:hypothetical protein
MPLRTPASPLHRLSARVAALLAALAFAGTPSLVSAGGTKTFDVDDFDDFDEGETEGAAIEGSGVVTVGYEQTREEIKGSRSVFTCLDGKREVLVGTADAATIQKISFSGRKGKVKVEKLADLDGVVVSAMTRLPSGKLLAATLPGGKIYEVDRKGKVSEFAKLDVEQIWALVPHKGRLLAATGPKGEVWSMSLDGKDPKVVLDVSDKDIMSLAVVGNDVVAGTSPKAKLYQVTDELDGRLLHDFKGDEVRAIGLTKDGLLVAVNDFEDRGLSSLANLTKQLNRSSLTGQGANSTSGEAATPKADAALYHVDLGPKLDLARATEAPWEEWLSKDKQYFTDLLAVDRSGTALVSSSEAGKIYRVRGRRDVATVGDLEERQATALCRANGNRVLATASDGAAVYRLQTAPASKAVYLSEIFDASQPADFGTVVLRGDGDLTLRARSGPSEEPDDRWSEWKKIGLSARGDGLRGSLSALQRRRYLQLEVTLGNAKSQLRDIETFYAPENLAPLLTSIDLDTPKFDIDDDDEPDAETTIKWKVDARDDDDLVYDVRIRPRGGGDDEWIVLTEDGPVSKKELELDLATIPDGIYEVEVTASDEPANGSAKARTDKLESSPFVVDRTRPTIEGTKVDGHTITGVARDKGSRIHDISYSIDGQSFRPASPADGLFDDTEERFEIKLPQLDKGRHRLVLRARDAHGNLRTMAISISG